MKEGSGKTPIACSLTTVELRDREAKLLSQFRSAVIEMDEIQGGYAFHLSGEDKWIGLVAELIVAERECCPFLTFEVTTLPHRGPLIVRVTGPEGTKEFLGNLLGKPEDRAAQVPPPTEVRNHR
jgi:hypothetical protein